MESDRDQAAGNNQNLREALLQLREVAEQTKQRIEAQFMADNWQHGAELRLTGSLSLRFEGSAILLRNARDEFRYGCQIMERVEPGEELLVLPFFVEPQSGDLLVMQQQPKDAAKDAAAAVASSKAFYLDRYSLASETSLWIRPYPKREVPPAPEAKSDAAVPAALAAGAAAAASVAVTPAGSPVAAASAPAASAPQSPPRAPAQPASPPPATSQPAAALAAAAPAAPAAPAQPPVTQSLLNVLLEMGIPRNRAIRSLIATDNASAQVAMDYAFEHGDDPNIDDPWVPPAQPPSAQPAAAAPAEPPAFSFDMPASPSAQIPASSPSSFFQSIGNSLRTKLSSLTSGGGSSAGSAAAGANSNSGHAQQPTPDDTRPVDPPLADFIRCQATKFVKRVTLTHEWPANNTDIEAESGLRCDGCGEQPYRYRCLSRGCRVALCDYCAAAGHWRFEANSKARPTLLVRCADLISLSVC